jgi:alanyl-tRNA synthetase
MSTSQPAVVVVARSRDVSTNANDVVAAIIARFGGKGGGRADMAQAGGIAAAAHEVFAHVRSLL